MPIVHDPRNGLIQLPLSDQLWRYMDFTKFVDILVTKKLHLTRVDKLAELGDKFEGSFLNRPEDGFTGISGPKHTARYDAEKDKDGRRFYYVNCWHGNDSESDAMWKLYVMGNQGVAIRTTVRQLKASLEESPEPIWIAKVQYLYKYEWKNLPDNPTLHACRTKRKSFKHENEVRLIWLNKDAEHSQHAGKEGKKIQCDPSKLIEKVFLAPTTNPWFKPVIEDVLSKYNIDVEVVPSNLGCYPS